MLQLDLLMDRNKLAHKLWQETEKLELSKDLPSIERRMKCNLLLTKIYLKYENESDAIWHFCEYEEDFEVWKKRTRKLRKVDHYYNLLCDFEFQIEGLII